MQDGASATVREAVDTLSPGPAVRKGMLLSVCCPGRRRAWSLWPRRGFALRVRAGAHGPKGRRVSAGAFTSICHCDSGTSGNALARMSKLSKTSIRRIQGCSAQLVLARQDVRLAAAAGTLRPEIFVSNMSFDDTSHKLSLPLLIPSVTKPINMRSHWKFLVSRQAFTFELSAPHSTPLGPVSVQLVRPCVPLCSSAAPSLMHGLFRHTAVQAMKDVEDRFLAAAPPGSCTL